MRTVVDTNVLVSGLLSPQGTPGRVVDLLLAGRLVLLADDRVLAEYADVLARPTFGFRAEDVARVVDYVRATAERISAPPMAVTLPDPGDLPFLEVAAAGQAGALLTGNTRHFEPVRGRHNVPVMTPVRFLAVFGGTA